MIAEQFLEHLAGGTTTTCRVWTVIRADGKTLGFTDHDCDLVIDGVVHRAESGMTARALQQSSGLAVTNTEAVGMLSDSAISDADLTAGRYDAARVQIWMVNWADLGQRASLFNGTLGEVTRTGAEFRAELRGLAEGLNQPVGRAYSRDCSAVLGDSRCRFDTTMSGYFTEVSARTVDQERRVFGLPALPDFSDRWFDFGRVEILSGAAAGLVGVVKSDRQTADGRRIELWQGFRAEVLPGDQIRIVAGCDKRARTCRLKFANLANFRGFPHIPGEDWLTSYPRSGQGSGGGSLFGGSEI
jgi:uncharacterized phage protein (TIGR02218 family)